MFIKYKIYIYDIKEKKIIKEEYHTIERKCAKDAFKQLDEFEKIYKFSMWNLNLYYIRHVVLINFKTPNNYTEILSF